MDDTRAPASTKTTSSTTGNTTMPESGATATAGATAAAKPPTTSTSNTTGATNNADNSGPGAMAPPPPPGASSNSNPGVADQTKNADNTKINDRDRHGAATPMDQGNSASELKITAAIRKAVVADKSLSFNAKNVKIITVGSKVTLRGPVSNDQERSNIEARAKATPGVTEVDNQIEVKK
jgi:hypothetical protein